MSKILKLYGLAGSGKTEYIARKLVDGSLRGGMKFEDMLSISFTKAAGQSLKERCAAMYKTSPHAIRHKSFEHANIRTLHSFAHEYFLKRYFGDQDPEKPRGRSMYYNVTDFEPARDEKIERALSKLRLFSYDEAKFAEVLEEIKFKGKILHIEQVYKDYIAAKDDNGKKRRFDYAEALIFARNSAPLINHWKLSTIDEAQDLSPLHWEIVRKHIIPNSDFTIVAGDPTQSIHIWAGADPEFFLNGLEGETEELKESYRVPANIVPIINALQREMTDGTGGERFQIHTKKEGGHLSNMVWNECLDFLRSQSDERRETLVLSLSGFQLSKVADSLISHGVLFMQDKRSEFTPWSPSVTRSDWYAYSLYYHIIHEQYDVRLPYSQIWRMVESSASLMETWSIFADSEDKQDRGFTLTVEDAMKALGIRKGLNKFQLLDILFEWPPRNRRMIWQGKEKDRSKVLTDAHYRILQYIESCAEGPYVEPVIKLSTVHGAKGLEADTVVILLTRDELRTSSDRRKLCINAICRSRHRVIFTWLNEAKHVDDHILSDKNLALSLSTEEYSQYLDALWYRGKANGSDQ